MPESQGWGSPSTPRQAARSVRLFTCSPKLTRTGSPPAQRNPQLLDSCQKTKSPVSQVSPELPGATWAWRQKARPA